jgi:hypothetical protein
MFLRELKEWGLLVIEYLPGKDMSVDILTKNLPGLLFAKHLGYVIPETKKEGVKCSAARESAGIKIVPNNEDGGNDISGNEENMNLGYKCEGATPDKNKCRRRQTLE